MNPRYCYWSVADGRYAELMAACVASARRAGVFKEFHVLTDQPIAGCECYQAQEIDKADGFFKLAYLKGGMSKLIFDYFVWIDADSWFTREPVDILAAVGRSPLHVPLGAPVSIVPEQPLYGITAARYAELMAECGVYNPVYAATGSFWIVKREAIDRVCELAGHFRAMTEKQGLKLNVSACLGYAMQMLCADPESHRVAARPGLWASDDLDFFQGEEPDRDTKWPLIDPLTGEARMVSPAIVHLPHRKSAANQLYGTERYEREQSIIVAAEVTRL